MRNLLWLALVVLMLSFVNSTGAATPASGEEAVDAIKASPRHGEWVDVQLSDGKTMRAWIVYPERADPAPVVIVIHEIFGLTDWIRGVTDALAAEGYIAIAPDLLWGQAPNGEGTAGFEGDAVRGAIRALQPEFVNARLDATRAFGLALPSAGKASGVVGFCWGGSRSFDYASHQKGLNAAVVYYGTGPADVGGVACPVLGLYGGDDARVTSTVDATEKAMSAAGKAFVQKTYPNAGHGFLRQQAGREGANQTAANEAWKETIAFFKQYLK